MIETHRLVIAGMYTLINASLQEINRTNPFPVLCCICVKHEVGAAEDCSARDGMTDMTCTRT